VCRTCSRAATTGAGRCTGGCWQGELCGHAWASMPAHLDRQRWYVDWYVDCPPPPLPLLQSCKWQLFRAVHPVALLQHDVCCSMMSDCCTPCTCRWSPGIKIPEFLACVSIGLVLIFAVPKPHALTSQSWGLFGVFIATICGKRIPHTRLYLLMGASRPLGRQGTSAAYWFSDRRANLQMAVLVNHITLVDEQMHSWPPHAFLHCVHIKDTLSGPQPGCCRMHLKRAAGAVSCCECTCSRLVAADTDSLATHSRRLCGCCAGLILRPLPM